MVTDPRHPALSDWHLQEASVLAEMYDVAPSRGLDQSEVQRRQTQFGKNTLPSRSQRSVIELLAEQFRDVMVLVLLAAAMVSGLIGEWIDTAVIVIIIVLNACFGLVQSWRADKALAEIGRAHV